MFSARFETARSFAGRLHPQQVCKGGDIPYIGHLLGVASIAIDHGATEDQGGVATEAVIRTMFGDAVTNIVRGCTDADVIPKPPWRDRKEQYIAHQEHATPSVRLVSAADKLQNARAILGDYLAIGEDVWERFKGGREGTMWYYRSLADTFDCLSPGRLADELSATVKELERSTAHSEG